MSVCVLVTAAWLSRYMLSFTACSTYLSASSTNSASSRVAVWMVPDPQYLSAHCVPVSATALRLLPVITVLSIQFLWTSGLLCCRSDDIDNRIHYQVYVFMPPMPLDDYLRHLSVQSISVHRRWVKYNIVQVQVPLPYNQVQVQVWYAKFNSKTIWILKRLKNSIVK